MIRIYNSVNKEKDFVQQFFDSSEGHFTHVLCGRTGSINVFLYAVEFVTVTQTLEGVSVSNKFGEFSQPHTR